RYTHAGLTEVYSLSLHDALPIWNSWNTFACNVDEQMIRAMADAMVESGMKDAGYEYINIDDCWHGERDKNGNIQVNKKTFPSGRSEEHTSELQSRENLVCRLLLE